MSRWSRRHRTKFSTRPRRSERPARLVYAAQYPARRILRRTARRTPIRRLISCIRTSTRLEHRPSEMIVAVDEADQRYDERVALLRGKRAEQTSLCPSHRPVHFSRQPVAGAGQSRKDHPRVFRAAATLHQPASCKPVKDVGNIGAIDSELTAQRILVEIGVERERRQQSVLNRCDVVSRAFLEKQRVMDLMQAPQEIPGPPPERHLGVDSPDARLTSFGFPSPDFPSAGGP